MKELETWITPDVKTDNDLVNYLYTNHNELYGQIQKIVKIKKRYNVSNSRSINI